MITRTLSDNINEYIDFFPCVGILGPRQVGKTTFVKQLQNNLQKDILYLDLEDSNDYEILSGNPQWFLEQHREKLVIIDEIQRELSLFPLLRALIDKTNEAGQFVVLGSASPELLSKSSETLAGRIMYLELTPLNQKELINYNQKEHWFKGGYPKAFLAPNLKMWNAWHRGYLKTYIESDLRNLGLLASPQNINRLLKMIASCQGALINYSDLSKSLGLTGHTVKSYIDFFEHTYIVRRLEPFYINIGKRLVKSPKIYIRDTGILHHLLSFNNYEELIAHPLAGNSWEGFVIEQIVSQLNESCTPYFYRTQKGAEVDLCIVKGQTPIVTIEIKLSNKPSISRGNNESIKDLNTNHNLIITFDEDKYQLNETWQVMSINHCIDYLKQIKLID